MSLTRVSEQQLNDRREELSRLKSEVREIEAIQALKDSEPWKKLEIGIKNAIKANQDALEQLLDTETTDLAVAHSNARVHRAAVKTFQMVLDQVNGRSTEAKRARIESLSKEIKSIETEQGL